MHGGKAMHFGFSGFLDKPFAAFGAADIDFSPASGYPNGLLAAGAAEIPMLFVLQVAEEVEECRVLPPSGLQITGIHAEEAPE